MIIIFFLILIVQLIHFTAGIRRKDKEIYLFSMSSICFTLTAAAVTELKLHHLLRNNFGIPNMYFYIFIFIITAFYAWKYRSFYSGYRFILIAAAAAWIFSGFADLLSDAGILIFQYISIIEELLLVSGGLLLLVFYILVFLRDYNYSESI